MSGKQTLSPSGSMRRSPNKGASGSSSSPKPSPTLPRIQLNRKQERAAALAAQMERRRIQELNAQAGKASDVAKKWAEDMDRMTSTVHRLQNLSASLDSIVLQDENRLQHRGFGYGYTLMTLARRGQRDPDAPETNTEEMLAIPRSTVFEGGKQAGELKHLLKVYMDYADKKDAEIQALKDQIQQNAAAVEHNRTLRADLANAAQENERLQNELDEIRLSLKRHREQKSVGFASGSRPGTTQPQSPKSGSPTSPARLKRTMSIFPPTQVEVPVLTLTGVSQADKIYKLPFPPPVGAPQGEVTLVVITIEGAMHLWIKNMAAMKASMQVYHTLVTNVRERFGGYEVHAQGYGYQLAFQEPQRALDFATTMQTLLLAQDWPPQFKELELEPCAQRESKMVDGKEAMIFYGLRAQIAIHTCRANAQIDPFTGKMDYYGNPVTALNRLLSVTFGGEILGTDTFMTYLHATPQLMNNIVADRLGPVRMDEDPSNPDLQTDIFQIFPKRLKARQYHFQRKRSAADQAMGQILEKLEMEEVNEMHGKPDGDVALVWIQIFGFDQWSTKPNVTKSMIQELLQVYQNELNNQSKEFDGLRSRIENDRALFAFADSMQAVEFAFRFHEAAMGAKWPSALLALPELAPYKYEETTIFNGPRFQIGIHSTEAELQLDPHSRRPLYYGPEVNTVYYLADAARAGETIVSYDVYKEIGRVIQIQMPSTIVASRGVLKFQDLMPPPPTPPDGRPMGVGMKPGSSTEPPVSEIGAYLLVPENLRQRYAYYQSMASPVTAIGSGGHTPASVMLLATNSEVETSRSTERESLVLLNSSRPEMHDAAVLTDEESALCWADKDSDLAKQLDELFPGSVEFITNPSARPALIEEGPRVSMKAYRKDGKPGGGGRRESLGGSLAINLNSEEAKPRPPEVERISEKIRRKSVDNTGSSPGGPGPLGSAERTGPGGMADDFIINVLLNAQKSKLTNLNVSRPAFLASFAKKLYMLTANVAYSENCMARVSVCNQKLERWCMSAEDPDFGPKANVDPFPRELPPKDDVAVLIEQHFVTMRSFQKKLSVKDKEIKGMLDEIDMLNEQIKGHIEELQDKDNEKEEVLQTLLKLHANIRTFFAMVKSQTDALIDDKKPPYSDAELITKIVLQQRLLANEATSRPKKKDEEFHYNITKAFLTEEEEETHKNEYIALAQSCIAHLNIFFLCLKRYVERVKGGKGGTDASFASLGSVRYTTNKSLKDTTKARSKRGLSSSHTSANALSPAMSGHIDEDSPQSGRLSPGRSARRLEPALSKESFRSEMSQISPPASPGRDGSDQESGGP